MRVVVEDFGAAPLIAEYDAEEKVVRVNARMLERMRVRHGDEAANALIACALAHEEYHVSHPAGTEEEAHAHARAVTGHDPRVLEAMLR